MTDATGPRGDVPPDDDPRATAGQLDEAAEMVDRLDPPDRMDEQRHNVAASKVAVARLDQGAPRLVAHPTAVEMFKPQPLPGFQDKVRALLERLTADALAAAVQTDVPDLYAPF